MKKIIPSLFVTTFLVHAPLSVFAGIGNEDYVRRTYKQALTTLEEKDITSLPAYRDMTYVARVGSKEDAPFDLQIYAEDAFRIAKNFIKNSTSSLKDKARIAYDVADIYLTETKRNFSKALDLYEFILEAREHYDISLSLQAIANSETAQTAEREKAHDLYVKYTKLFRPEDHFQAYFEQFKFIRDTDGLGSTRAIKILDQISHELEASPSPQKCVEFAKYFEQQTGLKGPDAILARTYYLKAIELESDRDVLAKIRDHKLDFFATPEEFYIFLIKALKGRTLEPFSIFKTIMESEDSPSARFLKLYFGEKDSSMIEAFAKENFIGFPLVLSNAQMPLDSLRSAIFDLKREVEAVKYHGSGKVRIFDPNGLNFTTYSLTEGEKMLENLNQKAKVLSREIESLCSHRRDELASMDPEELYNATMLYHLMFHNKALSLTITSNYPYEYSLKQDYEDCLRVLVNRQHLQGLKDYIYLWENSHLKIRRDTDEESIQLLKDLEGILNTNLDASEKNRVYKEKLLQLK